MAEPAATDSTPAPQLFRWQARIFSLLWLAYASYYLCRLNFSAAQPAILKDFPEWTDAKIGLIPSVYAAVYAVGQFVNGQLAVRLGARRMMTIAMVCAGSANVAFSQVSSYPVMLVLWGLNGWAQSAGWSLAVGTMASWTRPSRRGFVIGLLSTCYMFGNVFAWLLAGTLANHYGWRTVFAVPGFVLLPMAALFAVFLRNRPEDAGLPPVVETERVPTSSATPAAAEASLDHLTAGQVLRMTLSNRVLWVLATAFFCSNAVRYAFMNWSIQYIARFHGEPLGNSTFKAVGALGVVRGSLARAARRRHPGDGVARVGGVSAVRPRHVDEWRRDRRLQPPPRRRRRDRPDDERRCPGRRVFGRRRRLGTRPSPG